MEGRFVVAPTDKAVNSTVAVTRAGPPRPCTGADMPAWAAEAATERIAAERTMISIPEATQARLSKATSTAPDTSIPWRPYGSTTS